MKLSFIVSVFFSIFIFNPLSAQELISLEEIIALALEQNYDVRISKSFLESAATDNKYAVGAFFPVINATASRTWNVNNQRQILANDSLITRDGVTTNNLNASAQLSWLLFDGARMFATRERISEIAAQGEVNVKNQMVNTISDIVLNYYNVVRQKQQLNATREQMILSEERVRLADRRLQVGTGAKPELLQAKVDLNAQRTLVVQQKTLITQLKDRLNGLVSNQLPPVYEVADTILIDLGIEEDQISNNIENTNYSLMSFRQDINIASLQLRERKGERYPFINFNGSYNFSRFENDVAVNNFTLLYNRNIGFNYGLSVNLPIMNGFINRRNIQQARLTLDRSKLIYDQARTNVDVAIKNAFVAYKNAIEVLLIEEENIGLAKENIYIALESFKRSANTFIELRTAQQSLAEAYNRLINARYLAKVAETDLLRLNGSLLKDTN